MANNEKSYGWLGVDMPRDIALRLAIIQRAISPEDLYTEKAGFGLERHPHTTVAYGHEETDPASTIAALSDIGAGEATIKDLGHFDNADYKVLKFKVDSEHLHNMNRRLRQRIPMPGETFSQYNPHVTVAYLKSSVDPKKYQKLGRLLQGKSFPVKMLRWGSPQDEYRTLLLKEVLAKTAGEGLPNWIEKVEGHIPVAKQITNAAGVTEPYKTVGTGHYLSPANKPKLAKLWGALRLQQIMAGSPITRKEDTAAVSDHLEKVVPRQLDQWNPRWRKLNPMMQAWLKTHAYALGNNISKFKQGSNAVNAMSVNPGAANAARLWDAFNNSRFRKQTGTRMDKTKPLFEAGKRIALQKQGAEITEGNAAGQQVDTEPTEGQKEAGNYKKAVIDIDGLVIKIENPFKSVRSGVDDDGNEWSQRMWDDYGYVAQSDGVDADPVDVFVNPELDGRIPEDVYIVNQMKGSKFDEHKCMIGYNTEAQAKQAYLQNYEDGWQGCGTIITMPWTQFKEWAIGSDPRKGQCTEAMAKEARLKFGPAPRYICPECGSIENVRVPGPRYDVKRTCHLCREGISKDNPDRLGESVRSHMQKKADLTYDMDIRQIERDIRLKDALANPSLRKCAAAMAKEAKIILDIDVGDTILCGRFKNKPVTVESIGTDSNGQVEVNGRKLLAVRIAKLMPKKPAAATTSAASKKLRRGKATAKAATKLEKSAAISQDALRRAVARAQRTAHTDTRYMTEQQIEDLQEGAPIDPAAEDALQKVCSMFQVDPDRIRARYRYAALQKQAAQEWIGVDLDGCLARYTEWKGSASIGNPVPRMVARVKKWLQEGKNVKIFTARASGDDGTARRAIAKWTKEHIGQELPVTCIKDRYCTAIYDDKARGVTKNRGKIKTMTKQASWLQSTEWAENRNSSPIGDASARMKESPQIRG